MRPRILATAAACALLPLALAAPAAGAPTCPAPGTQVACGGRIIAEPENSTTFHQFSGVEDVGVNLRAIEALSPRFLEVRTLAEWTGVAADKSFKDGKPVYVVRVTDESVPRNGKKQVAASLSVHGLESAGREGGLRYVEDLARATAALATTDDPMYAGDLAYPTSQVMRETETWIGFTNPDGWAAGDFDADALNGPGFERNNGNNKDLNRDFATVGWFDRTNGRGLAESEPEIAGWTRLVRSFPNLVTSTDIHGELTTPNEAISDLIIPAGQWSPTRQEQVDQFSLRMIRTVERKFAEEGVLLDQVLAPLPSDGATPRKPANVAASYDIVGYDDSGFMGDWFSQTQDSVHMDVETFLSNLAPNVAYVPAFEQAHAAAVRGNIEATIVEALVTEGVRPVLNMKRVAYVDDSFRTSSDPTIQDGNPGTGFALVAGETQVPYDVSRLAYLEVLEQTIGRPVDAVSAQTLPTADLSAYDTLVVADMELPAGSTVNRAAYVGALDAFALAGGQLLLTDRALGLLPELSVVPKPALTVNRTDAGHVDFVAPLGDHPYEQGLVGKPSQTYYEVMLGFPSRVSAPNYGVVREAWETAGGSTVATVGPQNGDSVNTALGSIPRGKGRITVFGAILPQAIEKLVRENGVQTETPHPFGLADYAVTITGGQVFDNVLAYDRDNPEGGVPGPVVPEVPVALLLPVMAAAVIGGTVLLRRRRGTCAATA